MGASARQPDGRELRDCSMTLTLAFDWEEPPAARTLSNPGKSQPSKILPMNRPDLRRDKRRFIASHSPRGASRLASSADPFHHKGRKRKADGHGCIKIAAHAKFIEPLSNALNGVVETITLRRAVLPGAN
jgi:hypothetical protein